MSRLPEIFVKRIELPGGGHADACALPEKPRAFGKAWSPGDLRGFLKNCGIGSGGFQAGNDCAKGDGGTAVASGGKASAKVKAWAKSKWGDELAANGRTKAENFTEWFGDSGIVNSDGEPLLVWHGVSRESKPEMSIVDGEVYFTPSFSEFSSEFKIEPGIFFSPDKKTAEMYGTATGPYYLKAENLVQHEDTSHSLPEGVDGIYRMRSKLKGLENAFEIAVFDPNSIKLAVGNAGNFDPSETDIRKSTTFTKALSPADISQFLKSGLPDDSDSDDSQNDDPEDRSLLMAEILFHVYGDDALAMLDGEYALKSWDESKYERDRDGKFKRKGAADTYTYQAASKKIKTALKGKRTATSATELADVLSGLTVAQLKDLKAEYGIAASGRKAEFVQKIADRLDRGRREERKKKAAKKKAAKKKAPDKKQEPERKQDANQQQELADQAIKTQMVARIQAAGVPHRIASNVSPQFLTTTAETLEQIPVNARRRVAESGNTLVVGEFLSDVDPELKGVTPRGWPAGYTWDNAEGFHDSENKIIGASEFRNDSLGLPVKSERAACVVAHEFGHAYDSSFSPNVSISRQFIAAYEADKKGLKDEDKKMLGYFLQSGGAGRSEAVAEGFAIAIGNPGSGSLGPLFKQSFPKVMAHIEKLIKNEDMHTDTW